MQATARKAALEAKAAVLRDFHSLQLKELEIIHRKAEINLKTEISAAEAEKTYEEDEEKELDNFAASGQQQHASSWW